LVPNFTILFFSKGEWNHVQHISITKDLYNELENLSTQYSSTQVAYVRALSFVYPQKSAMLEVANRWKGTVDTEHGGIVPWGTVTDNDTNDSDTTTETTAASETTSEKDDAEMTEREKIIQLIKDTAMFDDDDDEDDDEFEFDDDNDVLSSEEVTKNIDATRTNSNSDDIISPFDSNNGAAITDTDTNTDVEEEGEAPPALTDENGQLVFNPDNVNAVLDEIRPYLISDGGNVSVQRIDVDTRSVYLKLEGACGSCASSTVTMSMGIERVLKENFDNLGEVLQVEDEVTDGGDAGGDGSDAEGLTEDAIIAELKRIGPAITAMGGTVEIVSVDPIGVVELRYRGSTKIQQGLELAIRDVPLVKHVKFVN
jgi:Fe-S cluster biogenesis protein NfuA